MKVEWAKGLKYRYWKQPLLYCDTYESTLWTKLYKLEVAGTDKNVVIHAGNVFVPRNLGLWPFDLQIYGFPELMVEHFFVKFG